MFLSLLGEMIPIDYFFSDGLVQPPTSGWFSMIGSIMFNSIKELTVSETNNSNVSRDDYLLEEMFQNSN